jgi:hypothetical protein
LGKPIVILAIALLPSAGVAGDSIFPEYAGQQDSAGSESRPALQFTEAEWKRYDKNRDGVINKREAGEMDPRSFTYADLNANGKISRKEWQAIAANSRSMTDWQRADRDNDGFLTRIEAIALDTETFKRMDSDGDNQLSQKEWDHGHAQPAGVAGRKAPLLPESK